MVIRCSKHVAEEMKRAYHFDWLSWTLSWTVPRKLSFLMVRRNLDSGLSANGKIIIIRQVWEHGKCTCRLQQLPYGNRG